jgi:hypothetical protein
VGDISDRSDGFSDWLIKLSSARHYKSAAKRKPRKIVCLAALAHAIDALRKLQAALDYVGPGLADMLVSICCEARGLEECEKLFALPQRSAKLMLKLGLMRLSVFYGLQSASAASASFRIR